MKKALFAAASILLLAIIALILFMPNSLSKIFGKEEKPVDKPSIKIGTDVSTSKNSSETAKGDE